MKGGVDLQRYVDLLVPHPAKIRLVSGEGPLSLVGSHCVDFYNYRDIGGNPGLYYYIFFCLWPGFPLYPDIFYIIAQ